MGHELQDDLTPPERCHLDYAPESCKDCSEYYLRGHRTDLDLLWDGCCMPKEDLDEFIESFIKIPEEYVIPTDTLAYASSAWEDSDDK